MSENYFKEDETYFNEDEELLNNKTSKKDNSELPLVEKNYVKFTRKKNIINYLQLKNKIKNIGMRSSVEFPYQFEKKILKYLNEIIDRAKNNNRETILERDL